MSEHIAFAAIRAGDKVYASPRPARHGDVIKSMASCGIDCFVLPQDQGFVTNSGRFVDRVEAREIAIDARQLLARASSGPELFSECVW